LGLDETPFRSIRKTFEPVKRTSLTLHDITKINSVMFVCIVKFVVCRSEKLCCAII